MKRTLAYQLLSIMLGVNFLFHGLARLFGGMGAFVDFVSKGFEPTFVPSILVIPMAYLIPPVELVIGLCLLIGFRPTVVLKAATLLMATLIAGMCLQQKWDVVGSQMVYAVCIFLLANELPKIPRDTSAT